MFVDCVEDDDDYVAFRQIPIEHNYFSSLWISETGIVKRRYFNVFTREWSWGNVLQPHINDEGKLFINIGEGQISLDTAISSAWFQNKNSLSYESDSSDEYELEDNTEYWKKMNDDIEISSLGKFRNKKGEVCEPTYFKNKRMICLPGLGAINVDNKVNFYFNNITPSYKLPKRSSSLLSWLREKKTVEKYAELHKLQMTTVWSYVYNIFVEIDVDECQRISDNIISDCSKNAMYEIFKHEKEHIFSFPAKVYIKEIDEILKTDEKWNMNKYKYEEIRILKLLCQKLCMTKV